MPSIVTPLLRPYESAPPCLASRPRRPETKRNAKKPLAPPAHGWRSSDEEEIARRQWRAQEEQFRVTNLEPERPVFSQFRIQSPSGQTYQVEIRDVQHRRFACECVDFRTKWARHLQARGGRPLASGGAAQSALSRRGGARPERVDRGAESAPARSFASRGRAGRVPPRWLERLAGGGRFARPGAEPEDFLAQSARGGEEAGARLARDRALAGSAPARRRKPAPAPRVRAEGPGRRVARQETLAPLFPYQREGMLHLAFTERALLADEMGLGKTIQAIAACALLHRLGKRAAC